MSKIMKQFLLEFSLYSNLKLTNIRQCEAYIEGLNDILYCKHLSQFAQKPDLPLGTIQPYNKDFCDVFYLCYGTESSVRQCDFALSILQLLKAVSMYFVIQQGEDLMHNVVLYKLKTEKDFVMENCQYLKNIPIKLFDFQEIILDYFVPNVKFANTQHWQAILQSFLFYCISINSPFQVRTIEQLSQCQQFNQIPIESIKSVYEDVQFIKLLVDNSEFQELQFVIFSLKNFEFMTSAYYCDSLQKSIHLLNQFGDELFLIRQLRFKTETMGFNYIFDYLVLQASLRIVEQQQPAYYNFLDLLFLMYFWFTGGVIDVDYSDQQLKDFLSFETRIKANKSGFYVENKYNLNIRQKLHKFCEVVLVQKEKILQFDKQIKKTKQFKNVPQFIFMNDYLQPGDNRILLMDEKEFEAVANQLFHIFYYYNFVKQKQLMQVVPVDLEDMPGQRPIFVADLLVTWNQDASKITSFAKIF